jgi:hypothetical protein
MWQFKGLDEDFSPRGSGFIPRAEPAAFAALKVAMGQNFSKYYVLVLDSFH